jgi:hypothetical protein
MLRYAPMAAAIGLFAMLLSSLLALAGGALLTFGW